MLTICNRCRITLGYVGLRINYVTHESAMTWVLKMRGYYHLANSLASDEVLDEYVRRNWSEGAY